MPSARDRLLHAAERCFEGHGITTTGINELITEAGVARMSLYNHFSSKDDLVVAYLERRDVDWHERIEARLAGIDDPEEGILAVIREYGGRVAAEGFRGCPFVNAAAELPTDHPAWEIIRRQKHSVRALLRRLATAAGVPEADQLADELFLLAEGAIVTAGIERDDITFDTAQRAARRLIQTHRADLGS